MSSQKEILTYKVAERRGAREQYIDGLNDIVCLLKGDNGTGHIAYGSGNRICLNGL